MGRLLAKLQLIYSLAEFTENNNDILKLADLNVFLHCTAKIIIIIGKPGGSSPLSHETISNKK